ncbi:MAG: protein required for normal CLN1 and CLN2 G1 cyclin expression, partial [Paramarteilia canceri]
MSEVAIKIDDLKNSGSPLSAWIKEGLKYYRNKKYDIFIEILEAANAHKFEPYSDHDQEYMLLLDTIAAYYAQAGQREKQLELKKEYFNKATLIYNNADKIIMYDENHLVGRAYFCLIEGEKIAQADSQFNFVINQNPKNLKALIGKAYIYFHKRDFKSALNLFKKALRINPNAPADIRIGIGHCFLKLGNFEKAKMAYERALEIDSTNCQALLGLGVLNLNKKTAESIKVGINYLSKAYSVDPTNAMVLNLLADHFFYKKDLEKVTKLSHQAFNSTENESIKAESSFQVARVFHYRKNYEDAYKYYYQSVQFASPLYIAPLFGLAQMYIEHREFENALQSINKILKHYPDNTNALKLHIYVSRKLYKNGKKDLVLSNCDKILKNSPFDLFALIGSAYYFEDQNYQ